MDLKVQFNNAREKITNVILELNEYIQLQFSIIKNNSYATLDLQDLNNENITSNGNMAILLKKCNDILTSTMDEQIVKKLLQNCRDIRKYIKYKNKYGALPDTISENTDSHKEFFYSTTLLRWLEYIAGITYPDDGTTPVTFPIQTLVNVLNDSVSRKPRISDQNLRKILEENDKKVATELQQLDLTPKTQLEQTNRIIELYNSSNRGNQMPGIASILKREQHQHKQRQPVRITQMGGKQINKYKISKTAKRKSTKRNRSNRHRHRPHRRTSRK